MLRVNRDEHQGTVTFQLVGTIDETSDFDKLFGNLPGQVTINCRKVERINSAGVRTWLRFFRRLGQKGIQFKLTECSPAIVEQFNVIKNFACGGEIVSIFIPYACVPCRNQFVVLLPVNRLKLVRKNLPTPNCPKCGRTAIFDELESEYFSFLEAA